MFFWFGGPSSDVLGWSGSCWEALGGFGGLSLIPEAREALGSSQQLPDQPKTSDFGPQNQENQQNLGNICKNAVFHIILADLA